MKNFTRISVVAALVAFGSIGSGYAQQQLPKAKAAPRPAPSAVAANPAPAAGAPAAEAAANAPAGWAVRCSSGSREAALECAMEQTAVLSKTGQLIVLVNVRVPSETRTPVALVQLPLGLNLPGGAKLQIDDGKVVDIPIQTCEARGCFAGSPIAPDLLAALKSGKQLKVSFQNLSKEMITIPMQLTDFATAYDKIK